MSGHIFAADIGGEAATVDLSGSNTTFVVIVGAIAVIALVMGMMFRRQVLAAGEGTTNMQTIGQAVQEGAAAFLGRQFRTLGVFAVVAFLLLFLLPASGGTEVRIGRSIFFLVGAGFSAAIGYLGMSLAVRANVRVAAAARDEGRDPAMRVAFRTGGVVGMATVGLGLLGAAIVVLLYKGDAPTVLEGFGFGAARHVHARRRRHLLQARGLRKRPARQGREQHPRGRPAQRRDHRGQRRRQRR